MKLPPKHWNSIPFHHEIWMHCYLKLSCDILHLLSLVIEIPKSEPFLSALENLDFYGTLKPILQSSISFPNSKASALLVA